MSSKELLEVVNFLRRGENKSTLSQIILPFCSDLNGERNPVAFLTGNINFKANLRKDGKPVSFEEELKKLESEIANLSVEKSGQLIDLSAEIKRLQIETDQVDEKEIEIKEEWTQEDEILFKNRKERKIITIPSQPFKQESSSLSTISSDIEELLRLAEIEEEEREEAGKTFGSPSKVKEIRMEIIEQNLKVSGPVKEPPKLRLPKFTAINPLVGEIIERETEKVVKPRKQSAFADEVSNRIILNDLKWKDLKSSAALLYENNEEEEEEEKEEEINSTQLKKPSRFSLRKQ